MGLYLAFAVFWLYSAFSNRHRSTAVLTCVVFAGGLVIGRCIGYFADGQPKPLLMLYIFLELSLIPIAYWPFKLPEDLAVTIQNIARQTRENAELKCLAQETFKGIPGRISDPAQITEVVVATAL